MNPYWTYMILKSQRWNQIASKEERLLNLALPMLNGWQGWNAKKGDINYHSDWRCHLHDFKFLTSRKDQSHISKRSRSNASLARVVPRCESVYWPILERQQQRYLKNQHMGTNLWKLVDLVIQYVYISISIYLYQSIYLYLCM